MSVDGRVATVSVAMVWATLAGRMLEECRLEEWAESMAPSNTCAQFAATCILTMPTLVVADLAQGGGRNSGIVALSPI